MSPSSQNPKRYGSASASSLKRGVIPGYVGIRLRQGLFWMWFGLRCGPMENLTWEEGRGENKVFSGWRDWEISGPASWLDFMR